MTAWLEYGQGRILPLLLASPVAVATSLGLCSSQDVPGYHRDIMLRCAALSLLLWVFCESLRLSAAYRTYSACQRVRCVPSVLLCNCPFADQGLMLNRKVELDDTKVRYHCIAIVTATYSSATLYRFSYCLQSVYDNSKSAHSEFTAEREISLSWNNSLSSSPTLYVVSISVRGSFLKFQARTYISWI